MTSAETSNITLPCIKRHSALSIPGTSMSVLYGSSNHVKHIRNILVYSEIPSSFWKRCLFHCDTVILILRKQVRSLYVAVWTDAFWIKKVIKSPVLPQFGVK